MNRRVAILLLGALALAVVLRCPRLGERPMHNDEGVNAIKFGQLWDHGAYKYDPNEHHGPALPYATWLVGRLTGAPDFAHYSEQRLRLVTVLFGVGLILLLPLVVDGLGRAGTAWAGLFTAVSPAMVFYSRYYIHEVLLVGFAFLSFVAVWRYWHSRRVGWMLMAGAALGLMDATKETFVLALAAAALALALNYGWNRWLDASGPPAQARRFARWHLAAGLGAWLVVAVVLFSSFLANPAGPLDSLRSYQPWLGRAGAQSSHVHPWYFYLHRLFWFHVAKGPVWSEALILALALVAVWAGFARHRLGRASASLVRFLAFFSFGLLGVYSLIAYKTPWCLLGFWHGLILLAGIGAAVLLRSIRNRAARQIVNGLLLIGAGHLAWQAWQASTAYAADQRNPYVYAQTSPDLLRLVTQVEGLAEASPEGRRTLIKVITAEGDCWPLPWYLRRFDQVGYWENLPPDPYAPVMIVSASLRAGLDEDKTHVMPGYYALRPQVLLEFYVETNLWTHWLERASKTRPPPGR